jgi:hypothetical protein
MYGDDGDDDDETEELIQGNEYYLNSMRKSLVRKISWYEGNPSQGPA